MNGDNSTWDAESTNDNTRRSLTTLNRLDFKFLLTVFGKIFPKTWYCFKFSKRNGQMYHTV